MVIHTPKTCGCLVAIVCARVLGHEEGFDDEERGMDLHSLRKCRYGEWATTVIDEYYREI